jgi:hypothetical protein
VSQPQEFDIVKLIELSRTSKYETTVAGFSILDKIDRVPIPKKWKTRKIAVQALYGLSENLVQYRYFSKEEKQKIQESVLRDQKQGPSDNFAPSIAPVSAEELEEEELPEEIVAPVAKEGDEDDDDFSYDDEEDGEDED